MNHWWIIWGALPFTAVILFVGAQEADDADIADPKTGTTVNPCQRQPFRSKCTNTEDPTGTNFKRSQFVLRYYRRRDRCVSYPFGRCDDENADEAKLFRYREDCELYCIKGEGVAIAAGPTTTTTAAVPTTTTKLPASSVSTKSSTIVSTDKESTQTLHLTPTGPQSPIRADNDAVISDCDRQRSEAMQALLTSASKEEFMPNCTSDGRFLPIQCHMTNCWCVDDKGLEIEDSRVHDGLPDCAGVRAAMNAIESAANSATKQILEEKVIPKHCDLPADIGTCNNFTEQWFHNRFSGDCEPFQYGGCKDKNPNNYPSKLECEVACVKEISYCPGNQIPLLENYGALWSCANSSCPIGYQCVQGHNDAACCPPATPDPSVSNVGKKNRPDLCNQAKDRGSEECKAYELRFYFNSMTNECKYFFFAGCGGNSNNFQTLEECQRTCHVDKSAPQQAQPADRQLSAPPASGSPPATDAEVCAQPVDAGPCRGHFERWVFDQLTRKCVSFTYSGCLGNGNNFLSEQQCIAQCGGDSAAPLPQPPGVQPPAVAAPTASLRPSTQQIVTGRSSSVSPTTLLQLPVTSGRPKSPSFTSSQAKTTTASFGRPPAPSSPAPVVCSPVDDHLCVDPCLIFTDFDGCRTCTCPNSPPGASPPQVFGRPTPVASSRPPPSLFAAQQTPALTADINRTQLSTASPPLPLPVACAPFDQRTCLPPCLIFTDANNCQSCACAPGQQQPPLPGPTTVDGFFHEFNFTLANPQQTGFGPKPPAPGICPPVERETCVSPCVIFTDVDGCQTCACNTNQPVTDEGSRNHTTQATPTAPHPIVNETSAERPPTNATSESVPVAVITLPLPTAQELSHEEKCKQARDPGPCDRHIERWYFDIATLKCEPFLYGGCGGNRNHFYTADECRVHCEQKYGIGATTVASSQAGGSRELVAESSDAEPVHIQQQVPTAQVMQPPPPPPPQQWPITHQAFMPLPPQARPPTAGSREMLAPNDTVQPVSIQQQAPVQVSPMLTFPPPQPRWPPTVTQGFTPQIVQQQPSQQQQFPDRAFAFPQPQPPAAQQPAFQTKRPFFPIAPPAPPSPPGPVPNQQLPPDRTPPAAARPPELRSQPNQAFAAIPARPSAPGVIQPNPPMVPKWTPPPVNIQPLLPGDLPDPRRGFSSQAPQPAVTTLEPPDNTCELRVDSGPCTSFQDRWFYNAFSGRCEVFQFGGCGGNHNNFQAQAVCEARCVSSADLLRGNLPPNCAWNPDRGPCNGYNVRYYFNRRNLRCEKFIWGGCGGNANNFLRPEQCEVACPVASKVLNLNRSSGRDDGEVFGYRLQPDESQAEETVNINPPPVDFAVPPVDTGFRPALIPRPIESNRFPQVLQIPPQIAIPPPQAPPPPPPPPPQSEPDARSPSFQPPSHAPPSASSSRGGKPEISFAIDEAAQSAPAVFKQEPPAAQLPIFFGTPPPAPQPWFNRNAPGFLGSSSFQNRPPPIPQAFQSIPAPVPIQPPPPPAFQNRPPAFRPPSPPAAASRPFFPPNFSVPPRPNNGNKLVPLCPNGLRALTFADGGVIRCLPAQQQCPQDASCNFNGLDFYCCPFISEASGGARASRPSDNTENGQTEG